MSDELSEPSFLTAWAVGSLLGEASARANTEGALAMADIVTRRAGARGDDAVTETYLGEINAVVSQYNELVARYNKLHCIAEEWMRWGDDRKRDIAQLKQDLTQANQRAQDAEGYLAAVQNAKRLTDEKLDSLEKSHRFASEALERLRSEYDDLAWAHKRLKEGGAS